MTLPTRHPQQVTTFFDVTDPEDIEVGDIVLLTAPQWNEFTLLGDRYPITRIDDEAPVFEGEDGNEYVIYGPPNGELETDDYRVLVIKRGDDTEPEYARF